MITTLVQRAELFDSTTYTHILYSPSRCVLCNSNKVITVSVKHNSIMYISNQRDVTVSRFLFWKLYMFRAFLAHHRESLNCIGSRWYNK
jgi:hypothetical protein